MLRTRKSACPFHIYRHEVPLRSRGIWEREPLVKTVLSPAVPYTPFCFYGGYSDHVGEPHFGHPTLIFFIADVPQRPSHTLWTIARTLLDFSRGPPWEAASDVRRATPNAA